MRRASLPVSLAALGLVLLALGLRSPAARAGELLVNGGFEAWPDASWKTQGGSWQLDSGIAVAGTSLRVDSSSDPSILYQRQPALAGATYSAAVFVRGVTNMGTASLSVRFLPASGPLLPPAVALGTSSAFVPLSASGAVAPAGTDFVEFRLTFTLASAGTMTAYVDSASLVETLPPPTSTPTSATSTPTATSTPVGDTATPASSPSSSPTPDSTIEPSTGTPTRTRTPTKTPTPDSSPGSKNTATPAKSPTTAATATPSGPTPTPALPPGTEPFGGLIRNGNFEWLEGPRAAWWAKFGGDLFLTHDAYRGSWAGLLASETSSTKWLHQVASVEAGAWYTAAGVARIASGDGEAFLRLSWYEAPDGSGSAIAQDDSPVTTGGWERLDTGPVQAPAAATSVRVRLMLRPAAAAPVQAAFDDVSLVASAPPEPPVSQAAPPPAATAVAGVRAGPASGPAGSTGPPAGDTPRVAVTVAGPNSLRLSEILSDPEEAGRDSAFEWVEVVNAGEMPVDTAGWKIGDGKEFDTLPSTVLEPGEFAVIAGRSAKLPAGAHVIRVADGEIGGGLNNSGDALRLVSPAGDEVDAVSFGDNRSLFDPAPPAPGRGRTLGVVVAGAEPSGANWALTERPTPGEPNVFPAPKPGARPAAATPGSDSQPLLQPAPVSKGDRRTVPWIVLGAALGAGTLGCLNLARRSGPGLRKRFRRGG